ncbi:MAG: zinc-ribbon domain-containing protein [Candidatus Hodarchaeota archaeon]
MATSPKVCPNCGSQVNEYENFCMNCGWVQDEKKVPKHLRTKMKKEEITLEKLIILCICLTPCGALLYYLLTQGE